MVVRPNLTWRDWQEAAARNNSLITLPFFETTPEAIQASVSKAIARANISLDELGRLPADKLTFENTLRALDDIGYEAGLTANRLGLIKETHPDPRMRAAATEGTKTFEEWAVGLDYREDVYAVVKAFAAKNPRLTGEDARLLEETLRDYKRAGLALPLDKRQEVERLRKELSKVSTDFDTHINQAQSALKFTSADLAGVPDSFLQQPGIKTGPDEITIMANVTWQYITVMDNATSEPTRQRLLLARENLARSENLPLLRQILDLRRRIASLLGYASWADYKIEPKMAGTAAVAKEFLQKLKEGLEPKFQAEMETLRHLKASATGDANARIQSWDVRYYTEQLKKQKYSVDAERLRGYFPYQNVLGGMFAVYERIFGLRILELPLEVKWVDDLRMFGVADEATGKPLGLFYLDMFPREGKYNHFAQFGIIEGRLRPDGKYQRPTVALICNFPSPPPGQPSLLTHADVETLFHEFGHAMHSILTEARHARFAGTSVPRDFVEAPSQMLENWVWDKAVLDSFAAHFIRPDEKIPQQILNQLKEAKLATIASFYRRQLSFALVDLALHSEVGDDTDLVSFSNRILSEVFVPVPADTAFVAYFGHLTGYDAGYYGYAWADAIAADMATVFERAPERYFDVAAGRRLRQEIYAPGNSRDVNISIERFLGRKRSLEPFLKTLGMTAP